MTILITGASGFIGSNLVSAFVALGHNIIATHHSNPPRSTHTEDSQAGQTRGTVRYVKFDLRSRQQIADICKQVDGIINVAAHVLDWGYWDTFLESNVDPIRHFIAEFEANNILFFIHTSSLTVHGFGQHRGTNEDGPYYPLDKGYGRGRYCNGYPRSKLLSEEILLEYAATSTKTKIAIIRPGNVYGPGDTTMVYKLIQELSNGNISYIDDGKYLTSPIYIDDLVRAYCKLFQELVSNPPLVHGRVYNVTSEEIITWKEFFDGIADEAGMSRPRLSIPRKLAILISHLFAVPYSLFGSETSPLLTPFRVKATIGDYNFSIERAKQELNWYPQVQFKDGIISAVEAWREHATD